MTTLAAETGWPDANGQPSALYQNLSIGGDGSLEGVEQCPYGDETKVRVKFFPREPQPAVYLDGRMSNSPAPRQLSECPKTGFLFYQPRFNATVLERIRPIIESADYQAVRQEATHYRAAWIMERLGVPRAVVFDMMSRAVRESSGDQQKRYLTELASRLQDAIAAARTDLDRDRLSVRRADMLRELGRFDEAKAIFAALLAKAEPGTVDALSAKYELSLIELGNSAPSTLPQNIYSEAITPAATLAGEAPIRSANHPVTKDIFGQFRGAGFWTADSLGLIAGGTYRNFNGMFKFDASGKTKPVGGGRALASSPLIATPDGAWVLAATSRISDRKTTYRLTLIDLRTVTMGRSTDTKHSVSMVGFSVHSPKLIFWDDNALREFDPLSAISAALPSPVIDGTRQSVDLLAADRLNPRVALIVGPDIIVWNYETGSSESRITVPAPTSPATCLVGEFGAHGQRLAFVVNGTGSNAGRLTLWDVTKGKPIVSHDGDFNGCSLSMSPDGRFGATASSASVTIWEAATGREIETMTAPGGTHFGPVRFSPDSSKLAISVVDRLAASFAGSSSNWPVVTVYSLAK